MSVKYTAVPLTEPDASHVEYHSIHDFDGRNKYNSIFSYSTISRSSNDRTALQSRLAKVCSGVLIVLCGICVLITFPISVWFIIKRVKEHEELVVFRLGRQQAVKKPGIAWVLPVIDRWTKVDMRTKAFSVPPQTIMTADGAAVELGADVYYCVKDAVQSVSNVRDLNHSTRLIARTSLQTHCGRYNLEHVEANRNKICSLLRKDINAMTDSWGVKVENIELSALKVLQQPNPLLNPHADPLRFIGAVLFPPGGDSAAMIPNNPMMSQWKTSLMDNTLHKLTACSTDAAAPLGEITMADQLIAKVKCQLGRHLVEQFGYVYSFRLLSTDGNEHLFYLDLKNGDGSTGNGPPPVDSADATLTLDAETMSSLFSGELSTFKAYMNGSLRVDGDLQVANKLGELVEMIRNRP